ncbi:MAG TPA: hypothetical protein VF888_05715, partial [Nitrospirota bacterium]
MKRQATSRGKQADRLTGEEFEKPQVAQTIIAFLFIDTSVACCVEFHPQASRLKQPALKTHASLLVCLRFCRLDRYRFGG